MHPLINVSIHGHIRVVFLHMKAGGHGPISRQDNSARPDNIIARNIQIISRVIASSGLIGSRHMNGHIGSHMNRPYYPSSPAYQGYSGAPYFSPYSGGLNPYNPYGISGYGNGSGLYPGLQGGVLPNAIDPYTGGY